MNFASFVPWRRSLKRAVDQRWRSSRAELSRMPTSGSDCAAAAKMGFSAYGITQGDDPVALAMKGLIDSAAGHEHQIALLWHAIEKLSARSRELPASDCVPQDAHTTEQFDAVRHRGDVVRDLANILQRDSRDLGALEHQTIQFIFG